MRKVVLKPDREQSLLRRHPWIFSGSIASFPPCEKGEVLPVFSSKGDFLATAYFHPENSLSGRVLSFVDLPIKEILTNALQRSLKLRSTLFDPIITNSYRLINGEGDGLPGLIVDCYADILVLQVHTYGMERLKKEIVDLLIALLSPRTIIEKSVSPARRQEGLEDAQGVLFGEDIAEIQVLENGLRFAVDCQGGQKTGFFLDQRDMRSLVRSLSKDKRVLNCFSYTGGFSISALAGGARSAVSVDVSAPALKIAEKNTLLNGFSHKLHTVLKADVFAYLQEDPLNYDLVILDPPAFAKKREDVPQASNGYREINRRVLEKLPSGSFLLTCSCSHFIDRQKFEAILFQASMETGRSIEILSRHRQALDHPESIYHPEGNYLKSLLLYVL